MSNEPVCEYCGNRATEAVQILSPPVQGLPDGLAHGKVKIYQVVIPHDPNPGQTCYVTFQYYTEYGDDCGVKVILHTDPHAGVEQAYLPAKALLAFADFFRNELQKTAKKQG